jgi:hypothetical protein
MLEGHGEAAPSHAATAAQRASSVVCRWLRVTSPDQRASREVPVAGVAFPERLGSGSEPRARVLREVVGVKSVGRK